MWTTDAQGNSTTSYACEIAAFLGQQQTPNGGKEKEKLHRLRQIKKSKKRKTRI